MFRNTRFRELMQGLPRGVFDKYVEKHQTDKHSKGFRSWDQLLSMLFAQLMGSRSLREIEEGFNSHRCHHYHLGTRMIKRSTLADANTKRDSALYADLCQYLLQQTHRRVAGELKDLLYLIDSTSITLKGLGRV